MKKQFIKFIAIFFILLNVPCVDNAYSYGYYDEEETISDPLEKFNRGMLKFNFAFYDYVGDPIVNTYRFVAPKPVRKSISNAVTNLKMPVYFLNSTLQGDLTNSWATLCSFIINSTVGVVGIFDVANKMGIDPDSADFGQTLGRYGIGTGVYLVLPFIGPSNIRDGVGFAANIYMDPLNHYMYDHEDDRWLFKDNVQNGKFVVSGIELLDSTKDPLDNMRKNSFDPYVSIRSYYQQYRQRKIKEAKTW